jgi:hypothetical protein
MLSVAMGLNVEFTVTYNQHNLSRVPNMMVETWVMQGTKLVTLQNGSMAVEGVEYFAVEQSSISGIDYEDLTTATVAVNIAGGLCDRTLGTAIIYLQRDLCPGFSKPLISETYDTLYQIPAQQMTLTFGELQTENVNFNLEVSRYLQAVHNNTASIDLRNATDNTVGVYQTVRFEYHPAPTLTFYFPAASTPQCTDPLAVAPLVSASLSVANVTITVTEQYPGIQACDNVVGNISITNYLGEEDPSIPLLTACRDASCILPLFSDSAFNTATNTSVNTNSRAVVTVMVGYPVLFAPFTKSLYARMSTIGHVDVVQVLFT